MDDELKPNTGSPQNQEVQQLTPKSGEKSQLGRQTQAPAPARMGVFPFGIPDSPAELVGDPLKEGAHERFKEILKNEQTFPEGDFDERLERRKESFGKMDSAMPEDEKNNNAALIELIRDNETLDDDVRQQVITALGRKTKEEARTELNFFNLSEEEKNKIISQLPESRDTEDEEPSTTQKEQMQANIEASQEVLNESVSKMEEEIAKAKKDASHDDKHIKKFERTREKIKELQEKMDEFLHPEDPLKAWSRRGGMVFYYTLLTAFMLVILEMHLLHQAAGKK